MTAKFKTHINALTDVCRSFPDQAFYRVPKAPTTSTNLEWDRISYSQFYHDVQMTASYWADVLEAQGVKERDVITVWVLGMCYKDVVLVFALSMAGYVPQLVSLRLNNSEVVEELMVKANSKAIIHETSFNSLVLSSHVIPTFSSLAAEDIPITVTLRTFPIYEPSNVEELAFIFHTSGSTSGSPKLVPNRYGWIDGLWRKAQGCWAPSQSQGQDVLSSVGSICHVGQMLVVLSAFQHGACVVQPTSVAYDSNELKMMIRECNLNRLWAFSPFIQRHLHVAQKRDRELLAMLQGLRQVLHTGLPLAEESSLWASDNGIGLTNMFGSTECGPMLASSGHAGSSGGLRILPGTSYRFVPIDRTDNSSIRLLELVVLPKSSDIPHSSLCDPDDGVFHTGDLFIEISRGFYAPQGRNDDWIKSENSLRCDTRSIEDNVKQSCPDLVADCVVVGNSRPCPALFVEPASDNTMTPDTLAELITERIKSFHLRRYLHERITDSRLVIVVKPGSLPRTATKGNIRRKQVEKEFEALLDDVYGKL